MTDEELYLKYEDLIASIATDTAKKYNCIKYNDNSISEYSKGILSDLKSEGVAELFRLLRLNEYDETKGEFSTYIYPYIQGVMRRYLEKNMGVMSVSKDNMDLIRKIQQMYFSDGKSNKEIAEELNLTIDTVDKCINYNTHFFSVNDVASEYGTDDTYSYLNISDNQAASKIVNKKICTELLEELFQQLPEQDRFILGHAFGVFGYEKKSLDDIAFEETVKIDGVEKAKKNAIRKLKELYPNSRLKDWKDIYRELMYDCTDE